MQKSANSTDNYIPIILQSIKCNTRIGCDIFVKLFVDKKERFLLYVNRNTIIDSGKIDLLKEHVERLYVRVEDRKIFLRYLESSLKNIVNDSTLNADEKAGIVYDIAKCIMIDVFENPRSGENVERSKELISSTIDFVITNEDASRSLIKVLSYDYYTYTHSVNVSVLGLAFLKYLRIPLGELNSIGTGLMLHDIGKTQIATEIIKKKGKLTEEEFAKIKEHVDFGAKILKKTGSLDNISLYVVLQHHEKYNGKGYPLGLKGENINKYGQLASIVDVYDALTTRRSYAEARTPFTALKIMKNEMKESFNEELLMKFIRFLGS